MTILRQTPFQGLSTLCISVSGSQYQIRDGLPGKGSSLWIICTLIKRYPFSDPEDDSSTPAGPESLPAIRAAISSSATTTIAAFTYSASAGTGSVSQNSVRYLLI